jgi:hypothetical protein
VVTYFGTDFLKNVYRGLFFRNCDRKSAGVSEYPVDFREEDFGIKQFQKTHSQKGHHAVISRFRILKDIPPSCHHMKEIIKLELQTWEVLLSRIRCKFVSSTAGITE